MLSAPATIEAASRLEPQWLDKRYEKSGEPRVQNRVIPPGQSTLGTANFVFRRFSSSLDVTTPAAYEYERQQSLALPAHDKPTDLPGWPRRCAELAAEDRERSSS